MRSFLAPKALTAFASLAALAALAACSDTTSPTRSADDSAAFTIGTTANVGPVHVNFASSAATLFCSGETLIYNYTVPATPYAPACGVGTAFDLSTALTTSYNPGWSAPITGSVWIGANATANEYRTNPGRYVFQHKFTIPTGVTSIVLNDSLKSDNAVSVYINGTKLEQQTIADCPVGGPCNWNQLFVVSDNNQAHFNANGVVDGNTVTVVVIDTPNGGTAGNGYACTTPYQPFGELGYGTPFNVPTFPNHVVANWTQTMTATSGCENPTGLDFSGNVSWVTPPTLQWCSPGFWKTHASLWSAYAGVLYSSLPATRAPLKAGSPANPTILAVVSNPQIYGGPATNSVADYLSGIFFGVKVGTSADDANCNNGVLLPPS